jgi:hypothetical protein
MPFVCPACGFEEPESDEERGARLREEENPDNVYVCESCYDLGEALARSGMTLALLDTLAAPSSWGNA